MMTHERFAEFLGDYAEGILPVGQMTEFRNHLATCGACAGLADAYTSALADLHGFPRMEVPEGFTQRILQRTTRRSGAWEAFRAWLGLPRLSLTPSAAGVLGSILLLFLAGTTDGRRVAREISMATHQTYSNAVRLYYRSSDLKQSAEAVSRKIPGQLEGSVDWIRQRLGKQPEGAPRSKEPGTNENSGLIPAGDPSA